MLYTRQSLITHLFISHQELHMSIRHVDISGSCRGPLRHIMLGGLAVLRQDLGDCFRPPPKNRWMQRRRRGAAIATRWSFETSRPPLLCA